MTTHNTSTPDSWEVRIEQFAKIVGLSKEEVEKAFAEKPFELTPTTPYVLEMFSDESILPFGDLRKIFGDDRDVSLPKLRLGVKYLRGPKEKIEEATSNVDPDLIDLQTKYGIKTSFDDLGPEELIPNYNPNKQNRITKTLSKIFGDTPVIAFQPDSKKVAVEETVNYITDLSDGLPETGLIEVDGLLVRLYPIGRTPNELIEEDPLYYGKPLRRGRSVINRVNWGDVCLETRQFMRILLERGEIDPSDRLRFTSILKKDIKELHKVFPEAYLSFREKKKNGDLPKLQLSIDQVEACSSVVNNPFGVNRSY